MILGHYICGIEYLASLDAEDFKESCEKEELRQVSRKIIEAIKRARDEKRRKRLRIQTIREEILRLMSIIAKKDKKINKLEETLRTLSYIKVEFPKVLKVD